MANAVATSSLFAEQQTIFQTAGDVAYVRRLQEFHQLFRKLVTQTDNATDSEVDAWEPAPADQHAAWEMYVELRTRISTQPLHYLSGDEGSALDSLHALFQVVRILQKKHGAAAFTVCSLITGVLNTDIRPLTAQWHKHKLEGKLRPEDPRREFRTELIVLQAWLQFFQRLLCRISCRQLHDGAAEERSAAHQSEVVELGDPINYDRLLGVTTKPKDEQKPWQVTQCQLTAIQQAESTEVHNRRAAAGQIKDSRIDPDRVLKKLGLATSVPAETVHEQAAPQVRDLVGLAISGGGIRSATFALGVLQGLATRRIPRQIDVMSTVSGGGYLGSFLSTWFQGTADAPSKDTPSEGHKHKPVDPPDPLQPNPAGIDSAPVRSLRNHSRYIQPSTFLGWLTTVGQAAYGIVSNLIILGLWVFLAVMITHYTLAARLRELHSRVYCVPAKALGTEDWTLHSMSKALLVGACCCLFLLPLAQRLRRISRRTLDNASSFELVTAFLFPLTAIVILIDYLPNLHYGYFLLVKWLGSFVPGGSSEGWSLTATSVAIGNSIGLLMARGEWLRNLAKSFPLLGRGVFVLLWLCGPVLMAYAYFELCRVYVVPEKLTFDLLGQPIPAACLIAMLAVGCFVYSMLCNVNFTSLHRFYRNNLCRTYLLKPADGGGEPAAQARVPLTQLRASTTSVAPYHMLNAALNLPASKVDELRGRNSDFFVFSKHFCGSPLIGYHQTSEWENADPHLDLGTAMAISGAAAAPQMGMGSIRGASFLMTLLNVRLGYWLRRPYKKDCCQAVRQVLGGPGPLYLMREALNQVSEEWPYLNLSDGGHIENLGVYELLRRRCKFIIAIDGECDPELTFPSLWQLKRFARVDLGTEIDINVERLEWTLPSVFRPDDKGERLIEDRSEDRQQPPPLIERFSRGHFAVGKIMYPSDGDKEVIGWLLYIKLSVTGNEPADILDYRRRHPDFPHQSTSDQVFEEDQFEAYRALGEHVAGDLFADEIVANCPKAKGAPKEPKRDFEVHDWFQGLATTMIR